MDQQIRRRHLMKFQSWDGKQWKISYAEAHGSYEYGNMLACHGVDVTGVESDEIAFQQQQELQREHDVNNA